MSRPSASKRNGARKKPSEKAAQKHNSKIPLTFRTFDHPMAKGRKPKDGEEGYRLVFRLENGEPLMILFGQEILAQLEAVIEQVRQTKPDEKDPDHEDPPLRIVVP